MANKKKAASTATAAAAAAPAIETTSPDARVIRTDKGCYFQQGDIKFSVDPDNIDKVLGAGSFSHEPSCIDKLMDSQVASLAQLNGLTIDPFVRHLVTRPLHGVVQLAWYRGLGHKVDFDHLEKNQAKRISEYHRQLADHKPSENGNGSSNGTGKRSKASTWAHSYKAVKACTAKGREAQLFGVIKDLGTASFAQIVEAAKDKVKTKQDMTRICHRFLTALVSSGCVEEVK